MSETNIIENIDLDDKNEPYKIQGYSFINRGRSKGESGGVGIFIKEGVDCKRRNNLELENIKIMWIEVFLRNSKNIVIVKLYRPPDTSNYLPRNFLDSLNETISYNRLKSNDNVEIKRALLINGFTQVVTKPTRITIESSTLIDIIATAKPEFIKTVKVIATSTSDHVMVCCIRKINYQK